MVIADGHDCLHCGEVVSERARDGVQFRLGVGIL